MKHIPMVSGGVGSWATASRVAEEHGINDMALLFADTLVEDDDTYRFLIDGAAQIAGLAVPVALREMVINLPSADAAHIEQRKAHLRNVAAMAMGHNPLLRWVSDGRTPFEVFHDDHFLGNSRLANCSKYLKQKPAREWLEANYAPDECVLYVGIDWTETHRIPAIEKGWAPHTVAAPLTEPPYIAKGQMIADAIRLGLNPPAAYADGLPHANCLAQGCVRGGQAYWERILRTKPEVYAETERQEVGVRETEWGAKATILKTRRTVETPYSGHDHTYVKGSERARDCECGGDCSHGDYLCAVCGDTPHPSPGRPIKTTQSTPLTLTEFREGIESQPEQFDLFEWGGCGCFTDDPEDTP